MSTIIEIPVQPTCVVFVGPCGCTACEKWADCDYCSDCNPYFEQFIADTQADNDWAEQQDENALPFGAWLFGDDED